MKKNRTESSNKVLSGFLKGVKLDAVGGAKMLYNVGAFLNVLCFAAQQKRVISIQDVKELALAQCILCFCS